MLVLTGSEQHELACGSCGAPLRHLKGVPVERRKRSPKTTARSAPDDFWAPNPHPVSASRKKHKSRKRRKSLSRRITSELFDVLEDIFD